MTYILMGLLCFEAGPDSAIWDSYWRRIHAYEAEGKYTSALRVADTLYAAAKELNHTIQICKSMNWRFRQICSLREDGVTQAVDLLRQELPGLSDVSAAIVSTNAALFLRQLGYGYRSYSPQANDYLAVRELLDSAIFHADTLKGCHLNDYQELVTATSGVDKRPTLYDLVMWEAIDFFSRSEPDTFRTRPAISIQTFLADPAHGRVASLFKELLLFHSADSNRSAYVYINLQRLLHPWFKTNDTSLVESELLALLEEARPFSIAAEVMFELATRAATRDRRKAAVWCRDAIDNYPSSEGAMQCKRLLHDIEKKEMQLEMNTSVTPSEPFLSVLRFRNLDTVYFRIVKVNRHQYDKLDWNDKSRPRYVARQKPVKMWKESLPPISDYLEHGVEILCPPVVEPGTYALVASARQNFILDHNALTWVLFEVTPTVVVTVDHYLNDTVVFAALDSRSGFPQVGRFVDLSTRTWKNGKYIARRYAKVKTDSIGIASFERPKVWSETFLTIDGHAYNTDVRRYSNSREEKRHLFVLTDRQLYRPGQVVHFKALWAIQQLDGNISPVVKEQTTIFLRRNRYPNSLAIDSVVSSPGLKGSFDGSFRLPTHIGTGRFYVGNTEGSVEILVEEYKRPSVEILLDPITESYAVGDSITVRGRAQNLSGAPLSGCQVQIRVEQRQFTPGRYPTYPFVILNDTLICDSSGTFEFYFKAIPLEHETWAEELPLQFNIVIQMTEGAGESAKTSQTIYVGRTPTRLALEAPHAVSSDSALNINIISDNWNGVPVSASVRLVVMRIRQPDRTYLPRTWERADLKMIDSIQWVASMPDLAFHDEDDPSRWAVEDTIWQGIVETGTSHQITLLPSTWSAGLYRVHVLDAFGLRDSKDVTIYRVDETRATLRRPLFVYAERREVEAGDSLSVLVGSGFEANVYYRKEYRNGYSPLQRVVLDSCQKRLVFPVTEEDRGGFKLVFFMLVQQHLFSHVESIAVPWINRQLKVELTTFRDKTVPGEKEKWTLRISNPHGEPVDAEITAAMVDMSLDFYASQRWNLRDLWSVIQPQYLAPVNIYRHVFSRGEGLTYERKWNSQFDFIPYLLPTLLGSRLALPSNGAGIVAVEPIGKTAWGQISGVVRDRETGDLLPGVNIILEGTTMGGATNAQGRFIIKNVPPGFYRLSTSMIGYAKVTLPTVSVYPGYMTRVFFDLTALSLGGEEVVIVAERPLISRDQTMTMTVTSSEDMTRLPIRGFTVLANLGIGMMHQTDGTLPKGETLRPIPIRKRFEETALWIPAVATDSLGMVKLEWTMPDALTRWRFQAFAYTSMLQIGAVEHEVQSQKTVMAQLFSPRFVRSGDTLELRGRLINMSDSSIFATVSMTVVDSVSGRVILDERYPVTLGATQTTVNRWTLSVPEGPRCLRYRLTIQASGVSDGEAGDIPVHPRFERVTEARSFTWNDSGRFLLVWNGSPANPRRGRRVLSASVQLENPIWKILSALPYLAEFPHECSEQIYARWFAAVIADHLFLTHPELKLDSSLIIDSVLTDLRRNELESLIRLRKDASRLKEKSLRQLVQLQSPSGGWSWFSGMDDDMTVTAHIASGLRHVRQLGIEMDTVLVDKILRKALDYLDRTAEQYVRTWKNHQDEVKTPHTRYLHYLYSRSGIKRKGSPAADQLMALGRANWMNWPLLSQAYFALACYRHGDAAFGTLIMESIRERATRDSSGDMYWPSNTMTPGWYGNPIETQALLLEAFAEIIPDRQDLSAMLQWLLRQKRASHWPTTKSTSEACFVLLQYGSHWTYKPEPIRIFLPGDRSVNIHTSDTPTPTSIPIDEHVDTLRVARSHHGALWGSWFRVIEDDLENFFDDGNDLRVTRTVSVFRNGDFIDVQDSLRLTVGERILIRLTIEAGQDVDFVHIVDGRSGGTDPGVVLSGYKFKNGIGYYESPRDDATHFYVQTIKKGKSIIEYPALVTHSGTFQSGLAQASSMYAPDYRGHSRSLRLIVRK
jgi:hypothetical protein